jgi:hypothetical protein
LCNGKKGLRGISAVDHRPIFSYPHFANASSNPKISVFVLVGNGHHHCVGVADYAEWSGETRPYPVPQANYHEERRSF